MLSKDPQKRRTPSYSFSLKLKKMFGGAVEEWAGVSVESLIIAFDLISENMISPFYDSNNTKPLLKRKL